MRGIHVGTRLSALALALGIASTVGCGSKSNPLADAKKMVGSHSGANTAITAANADSATADIVEAMLSGINRAIDQSIGGGPSSKRARPSTSVTIPLQKASYDGLRSGNVTIKSGHITANIDDATGDGTMSMNVAIELNDFSDDGVIFLGGTIDESVNSNFTAAGTTLNANMKANIAVAGKYQDSMSIDITMAMDATGKVSSHGTVTVGSQTHTINITDLKLF